MTIWMNNDKSLIITKYSIIRQGDDVSRIIYFLLPTEYNGVDLRGSSVDLIYRLPSEDAYTVALVCDEELYKNHLKFTIYSAPNFTEYSGDVVIKLVLCKLDGEELLVLNTGEASINIVETSDFNIEPTPEVIDDVEENNEIENEE